MMWSWEGMTDAEREQRGDELMRMGDIRRHFNRHSLRLVVDNQCPVRRPERGIQGIRRIYGGDDGGPDAA